MFHNKASCNTSKTVAGCYGSCCYNTLPLTTLRLAIKAHLAVYEHDLPHDVVGLIGIQGGPVGDVSSGGYVDAYITDRDPTAESEHSEASNQTESVESNDRPA